MNLLAIDTATDHFSVALASCEGDASRADTSRPADMWLFEADAGLRHSELVMECIDMLMRKASLKPEDLNGVLCMGGPGSFTGLRIGFSVAKGLALSLNIPLAAIPTLDCMAWPFSSWPGIIMPALDAKKGAFFCALYRGGRKLSPDMDATPSEIAQALDTYVPGAKVFGARVPDQTLLIGPGAEMLREKLNRDQIKTEKKLRCGNAATLLQIAEERQVFNNISDYSMGPEYIRKSDAEIQRTGNK